MPNQKRNSAVPSAEPAEMDAEARIRQRAYALWEAAGRPEGEHEAHWHEAAQQLAADDEGGNRLQGMSEPFVTGTAQGTRSEGETTLDQVERDAAPQFAKTRRGSRNSGMASAEPRVISGDEGGDATFPLKQNRGKRS